MTFNNRLLGTKLYTPPQLVNLIRTVAVKEFSHRQTPTTVSRGTIQDLHCYEDPPRVRRYLINGQTQTHEELTVKGAQWEPKSRFQHLFIYTNTLYTIKVAFL